MIQSFEQTIGGEVKAFCASLGEGPTSHHRVIISEADSALTLVVFDASGFFGALKAEIEQPAQLIADAISKAKSEGLIERALSSGEIQQATL
ncbi:hypothetical protein BWP39_24175 [Paraburkholderia acidicola]|uniref:Uncharacterized protein n=1 Tax=Paraburkholderia acidicola TaxID=1912599 RepID=A0A2A4EQS5_9BURK|nr:hypothetical protein [Paraburkholderia acidicola]PCE22782.1 hypothetical protein BWP39_24175 [Paraburkholderia acidicola]